MKLTSLFICNECKKVVHSIEDLLFIDDENTAAFCSEECIEKYYAPVSKFFQKYEKEKRAELKVKEIDIEESLNDLNLLNSTLNSPTSIWFLENELNEKIYFYIKKIEELYYIVICFTHENRPSFIFHVTCTKSEELKEYFEVGEMVDDIEGFIEGVNLPSKQFVDLDDETHQVLESKKSIFLAQLLDKRKDDDISYEKFHEYDSYINDVLEDPDEIYRSKDDENDEILCYFKVLSKDNQTFYYLVISMDYGEDPESGMQAILPILTFPTTDPDLVKCFTTGTKVIGQLKS